MRRLGLDSVARIARVSANPSQPLLQKVGGYPKPSARVIHWWKTRLTVKQGMHQGVVVSRVLVLSGREHAQSSAGTSGCTLSPTRMDAEESAV